MPLSHYKADDVLTTLSTPHIMLHTANPGADGEGSEAVSGTDDISRKPITLGSAENHETEERRLVTNTDEVTWTGEEIDEAQEITHFSVWDAETLGNPVFIGALGVSQTIGSDGAKIEIGDLSLQLQVFEKPV